MNFYRAVKRFIDITVALPAFILSIPFLFLASVVLLIQLRESPFFVQERGLSLAKERLKVYKLKTIRTPFPGFYSHSTTDKIFSNGSLRNNVSSFAVWLRKTGLDELPQLINVLKGEMSLIGPRPLMIEELRALRTEYPLYYKLRHNIDCKPGISGLWQVKGDKNKGVENLIGLDLLYELYKSSFLDFQLFISTLCTMLRAGNSDSIIDKNRLQVSSYITAQFDLPQRVFKTSAADTYISREILLLDTDGISNLNVELPAEWWYILENNGTDRMEENLHRSFIYDKAS